ncbi:agmatinase [Nocardia sp. NPDC058499]|uniref:agmatinase n=1 Tax=Nocardia sp. NPDC058499 TaxID=3346530 RepID=UPI00365EA13D
MSSEPRIDTALSPRYAQLPTFMRMPAATDPRGRDAVVIGAPYDGGTSYRPGARFGPRAIRAESVLLHGVGVERGPGVLDLLDVVDAGDLDLSPFAMENAIDEATTALTALYEHNRAILMLGGDHSLTLAALRAAHREHGPLAVIHLDAHSDTYPPVYGGRYHHGTPFRHAIDEGLVQPQKMVQIGIRGHTPNPGSLSFARDRGVVIVTMDDFDELGTAGIKRLLLEHTTGQPVYVSIDVDAADPAYAPGTGTPAPGGLTSREILALIKVVGDLQPVGFDIVEVSPAYDHAGITSLLAAEIGAELLYQYARSLDAVPATPALTVDHDSSPGRNNR